MANLKIDDNLARKIYPSSVPELKTILENSYPAGFFSLDTMDFVTSFEAACEYNNTNPNDRRFTQGTEAGNHMEMLAEIAKALNGGKVAKPGEKRYYPVFEYSPSGFRFDAVYFAISFSLAHGGPRLCVFDSKHAEFMGRHFLHYYDKFYNPQS